jgi:sirohydrochlorin ferrochelatase
LTEAEPALRPATGILLAAHGDGGTDPRDLTIRRLAEGLAARIPLPVAWATLKRPETFARARDRLVAAGVAPAGLVVMPLFMAEGWFVRRRLPTLLAEHGLAAARVLPALGLDPGLPALLGRRITELRAAHAEAGAAARLVLVAHGSGSGDTSNRRNAEAIAATLAATTGSAPTLAFIEEAPRWDEVIGADGPEIVVGLFVSAGTHALDDVATRVAASPSVLAHLPAIGEDDAVLDLVAGTIARFRADSTTP